MVHGGLAMTYHLVQTPEGNWLRHVMQHDGTLRLADEAPQTNAAPLPAGRGALRQRPPPASAATARPLEPPLVARRQFYHRL